LAPGRGRVRNRPTSVRQSACRRGLDVRPNPMPRASLSLSIAIQSEGGFGSFATVPDLPRRGKGRLLHFPHGRIGSSCPATWNASPLGRHDPQTGVRCHSSRIALRAVLYFAARPPWLPALPPISASATQTQSGLRLAPCGERTPADRQASTHERHRLMVPRLR
jgi:hypothetical protein